jgi:hypothetical protein
VWRPCTCSRVAHWQTRILLAFTTCAAPSSTPLFLASIHCMMKSTHRSRRAHQCFVLPFLPAQYHRSCQTMSPHPSVRLGEGPATGGIAPVFRVAAAGGAADGACVSCTVERFNFSLAALAFSLCWGRTTSTPMEVAANTVKRVCWSWPSM